MTRSRGQETWAAFEARNQRWRWVRTQEPHEHARSGNPRNRFLRRDIPGTLPKRCLSLQIEKCSTAEVSRWQPQFPIWHSHMQSLGPKRFHIERYCLSGSARPPTQRPQYRQQPCGPEPDGPVRDSGRERWYRAPSSLSPEPPANGVIHGMNRNRFHVLAVKDALQLAHVKC